MNTKRSVSKTIVIGLIAFCMILSSFALVFGVNNGGVKNASAQTIEVNTASNISQQGENGMYYCWGNVDNYMLMERLIWDHQWKWRGPYENYAQITGQVIHPGMQHASLYVWVADHSGTVTVTGNIQRQYNAWKAESGQTITTRGDGCDYKVVHQKKNEQVILLDVQAKTNAKNEISRTLTVTKGDSVVISVSAGLANNNVMDNTYCNIAIKYTVHGDDFVFGEDLTRYLHITNAGALSGYKHIEGSFEADVLHAEESLDQDETKVIVRTETDANALSSDLTTSELSGIWNNGKTDTTAAAIILSIVAGISAIAVAASVVLIKRRNSK